MKSHKGHYIVPDDEHEWWCVTCDESARAWMRYLDAVWQEYVVQ